MKRIILFLAMSFFYAVSASAYTRLLSLRPDEDPTISPNGSHVSLVFAGIAMTLRQDGQVSEMVDVGTGFSGSEFSSFNNVSVNNSGAVVFNGTLTDGRHGVFTTAPNEGIHAVSPLNLESYGRADINDTKVTFTKSTGAFDFGLYLSDINGVGTRLQSDTGVSITVPLYLPLSPGGEIAFGGRYLKPNPADPENPISQTALMRGGTVGDVIADLSVDPQNIDIAGSTVYFSSLGFPFKVPLAGGNPTSISAPSGVALGAAVATNSVGDALFLANANGVNALYLLQGGALTRIIGVGDSLDGSAVQLISAGKNSLSDSGEVVFKAILESGSYVYSTATREPLGNRSPTINAESSVLLVNRDTGYGTLSLSADDRDRWQELQWEIVEGPSQGGAFIDGFGRNVTLQYGTPNDPIPANEHVVVRVTDTGMPPMTDEIEIAIRFGNPGEPIPNPIPGFETKLNLARISQRPLLKADRKIKYDNSKKTLGKAGCEIAALAMILKGFGINKLSLPSDNSEDAEKSDVSLLSLNNLLKQSAEMFDENSDLLQNPLQALFKKEFSLAANSSATNDRNTAINEIRAGRPVMIEIQGYPDNYRAESFGCVKNKSSTPPNLESAPCNPVLAGKKHFVVAYGLTAKTDKNGKVVLDPNGNPIPSFLIHDPGANQHKQLDKIPFLNGEEGVQAVWTFSKGNPQLFNAEDTGISISTTGKVQIQLSAPGGQRTGVDFATNTKITEISDSIYENSAIADASDEAQAEPQLENSAQIEILKNASQGEYRVEIRSSVTVSDFLEISLRGFNGELNRVAKIPYIVGPGSPFIQAFIYSETSSHEGALNVSELKVEGSNFKIAGTYQLSNVSDGIDPLNEEVTVLFDAGAYSETIPAGSFIASQNGFEFTKLGVGLNKVQVQNDGHFLIEASEARSSSFDLVERGSVTAIFIGNDSFSGVTMRQERRDTKVLSAQPSKETYALGEKPVITARALTEPKENYEAYMEALWNGSRVKVERLENGLFSAVAPKVTEAGLNYWEIHYLVRDKNKADGLRKSIQKLKRDNVEAMRRIREGATGRERQELEKLIAKNILLIEQMTEEFNDLGQSLGPKAVAKVRAL